MKILDKKWQPEVFVVEWSRKNRLVTSNVQSLEQIHAFRDNSSKQVEIPAKIEWNHKLSMETRLYHNSDDHDRFDMKDYKFSILELRSGRSPKLMATTVIDLAKEMGKIGIPKSTSFHLKSTTRKIQSGTLKVVILVNTLSPDKMRFTKKLSQENLKEDPCLYSDEVDEEHETNWDGRRFLEVETPEVRESPKNTREEMSELKIELKMKKEVNKYLTEEIEALKKENAELSKQLFCMTSDLENKNVEHEVEASTELLRLRGELAVLKRNSETSADFLKMKNQFSTEKLQSELKNLRENKVTLESEIKTIKQNFRHLQLVYEITEKQNKKLKNELFSLEKDKSIERKTSKKISKEISKSEIKDTEKDGSPLENYFNLDATDQTNLMEELIELKLTMAILSFKVDEASLEKKELQNQLEKEKMKYLEASRNILELKGVIKKMEEKLM